MKIILIAILCFVSINTFANNPNLNSNLFTLQYQQVNKLSFQNNSLQNSIMFVEKQTHLNLLFSKNGLMLKRKKKYRKVNLFLGTLIGAGLFAAPSVIVNESSHLGIRTIAGAVLGFLVTGCINQSSRY